MDRTLAFATLHQLAALIQKRAISPVELTTYYLERIAAYDQRLNSYLCVLAERALAAARAAETAIAGGHYLGPLHGIPLAIKDLIDLAGHATTGGSLLFKNRIAQEDATVARRLAQAGALFLGKTQMVEFAFGGVGINHHYGTPWNPWDPRVHRIPGGSSSGSGVGVAADLAPAALGSDTGGSVRIPSSFCGLVGLKPTFGRISNNGVLPLDSSLDCIGPLTRSVRDAALLFQVLAGPDPADPDTWSQPCEDVLEDLDGEVDGMRLCLPREYFWKDVDPEVEAAVKQAAHVFADLGVRVDEVSLKELDELAQLRSRGTPIAVEAYSRFREDLEQRLDQFDPIVSARMLDGRRMSAPDYFEIQRGYAQLRRRTHRALQQVDALLTPTTPFAALPAAEVDREDTYTRVNGLCLRNTGAANLLGLCALSLPCGFTRSGLPIGLQLIGRAWTEGRLLRLAHTYEQATPSPWLKQHPRVEAFG
ncbi:MAG: amidase [Candidatus Latescibacteria bacterium]|nr:amidase [Candidatus Latescibacterota bacterium]